MYSVEVKGVEQVIKNLQAAEVEMKKAKVYKMRDAINYTKNYIKNNKLSGQVLQKRTGKLKKSIGNKINTSGQDVIGRVFPRVGANFPPYGYVHETGGIIKPKKKEYLHFVIGGNWVKVKQVKIPARPYMQPTTEEIKWKIQEILGEVAGIVVRKANGT